MLKGKAKEELEKWLLTDLDYVLIDDCLSLDRYNLFEHLTPSMKYGVLVDWFDSVGIYIEIYGLDNKFISFVNDSSIHNEWDLTRIQARQKAIEKANEIYNNRV